MGRNWVRVRKRKPEAWEVACLPPPPPPFNPLRPGWRERKWTSIVARSIYSGWKCEEKHRPNEFLRSSRARTFNYELVGGKMAVAFLLALQRAVAFWRSDGLSSNLLSRSLHRTKFPLNMHWPFAFCNGNARGTRVRDDFIKREYSPVLHEFLSARHAALLFFLYFIVN